MWYRSWCWTYSFGINFSGIELSQNYYGTTKIIDSVLEVGVHAYAQIANFRTSCSVSTQNIKHYLNRYLPMDIAIIEVEEVPERFHAQLNATSKTYVYRMTIDDVPSVFDRKYTYHCYRIPDKRMMQQAAEKLTGRHDFRNFSSAKKTKSTVREIFDIDIYGDMRKCRF